VCPYCDFAVVAGRDELIERYLKALDDEIQMEAPAGPLGSVFVGGGSPSRLTPAQLDGLLARLDGAFGLRTGAEVSLEANPEDWTVDYGRALVDIGFTRVSLGVQSFDDAVLAELGRAHSSAAAGAAVEAARLASVPSVSIDLIFGAPAESLSSWTESIEAAITLQPDHVSAYALTVERGTELSRQIAAGAPGPEADDQAEKYAAAHDVLTAAGYEHYEVSNYARPGHECRYNLNTWAQGDYLAFGLGAHGHRDGTRRRNVRRLDAYLALVERGSRPEAGTEQIDGWDAELERVFLGVRLRRGLVAPEVAELFAEDFEGAGLVAAHKVGIMDGTIRVLDPLFTDAVARVVLGLPTPSNWVSS
jgi:oxygen-independent coproporphyrinogen-3 oxidase